MPKNILFIMCDQLRFDYLGCTGHPSIKTPHIDKLAERGVRFDRAYVQAPICGPSRMSFYTGRYVASHGTTWNMAPIRVGEPNIGDHLNPLGMRTVLCGKTHAVPDATGMQRLGIDADSDIGKKVGQAGFEVWDKLDGIHPPKSKKKPSHYNDYLRNKGFDGASPWQDGAITVTDEDGNDASGWLMKNVGKPAKVAAEDSETAYTASRACEFIESAKDESWCLHLSFIKPHWPYVAPAPYHNRYSADEVMPAVRDDGEKADPHPVYKAFQSHRFSRNFSRDEVRNTVIPVYMGLISQIDDEVGRVLAFLKAQGLSDDTMIVFTSDHGDYLGDHWLGEKEFFHEPAVKIPLIIYDPSPDAESTRGMVRRELVEAIDLLPTFVEYAGGEVPKHILQGHSLMSLLRDRSEKVLRDVVISEYDYSCRLARETLGRDIPDCRLQMIFDGRWKMMRAEGFRPLLFDLETDPQELEDLGANPDYKTHVDRLSERLLSWATENHARITRSDQDIEDFAGTEYHIGILIGFWDEEDLQDAAENDHGGN
jgi:arylsulfatase A-like enzyme